MKPSHKILAVFAGVSALCCAHFASASQMTKAQLTTTITNQLPSSGSGLITAAILRSVLQDLVDSAQQIGLINPQTGTTYAIVAGDSGKLITFCNVAPIAVSLPQAVGSFAAGFNFVAQNICAGAVTITPTIGTINGAASLVLNQDNISAVYSGSNVYRALTYGTVSSLTCGAGLSGGAITTTGTCSITDTISANTVGSSSLVPVITFNTRGQLTTVTTATITPGSLGSISPLSVLGNMTASTSPVTTATYSQFADTITNQRGTMLFRGSTAWQGLGPCAAGQIPQFGGTGANMSCATVAGTGTVTSITQGAGVVFSASPLTVSGTISADIASTSNIWSETANKVIDSSGAASSLALTALTDFTTIAVDFNTLINASVTLSTSTSRILGNPTNASGAVGRCGRIYITQDATGSRTLTYASNWKFSGGTAPTLTTTPAAVDLLAYCVRTSTAIDAALNKDFR